MPAVRPAARLAAVLACLSAFAAGASARERPDVLVAQLAQATGEEPPMLSDEPPTRLGGGPDDGRQEASPGNGGSSGLADTGSDAGLLALAGGSLLGIGLSLRLRLRDAA